MEENKARLLSKYFDVDEWRMEFGRNILSRRQAIWDDIISAGDIGIISIYDALEEDYDRLSVEEMRRAAQALAPPGWAEMVGEILIDMSDDDQSRGPPR